jgi:hypothetical protein
MSLISARSAWDWAEKLAAESDEAFEFVLREILAAVDRRDVSAVNPSDPAEHTRWRLLLPVMIDRIDRNRRGHIDPEPVFGPGILGIARSLDIDTAELERWLSTRGIERRSAPTAPQPSDVERSDHAAEPRASDAAAIISRPPAAEAATEAPEAPEPTMREGAGDTPDGPAHHLERTPVVARDDLQVRYNQRVTKDYAPTLDEDFAWVKKQKITRRRLWQLRRDNPDERLHRAGPRPKCKT